MSREHALLMPIAGSAGAWKIKDCESKNGIRRDGARDPCFRLHPGVEITIGGLRVVAESAQLIALRGVICRFLGWRRDRQDDVDSALRALRSWAAQDLDLVLLGDGDLTPVLNRWHRLTLGIDPPLVAYDGGDPGAAVHAAALGTLHVAMREDDDISKVISKVRATALPVRPQLVVSASSASIVADTITRLERSAVISLPPLSSRTDEIERIVGESAIDVVREMGVASPGFTPHDEEQIRTLEFKSVADIEKTVRRIIALRTWGLKGGAARLGIKHPSLHGWAQRRNLSK